MIKNNAENRMTGAYRMIQEGPPLKVTVGRLIKPAPAEELTGPSLIDEIGEELAISMMAEAVQEAIQEDQAAGISRIISIDGVWYSVDKLGQPKPLKAIG